MDEGSKDGEVQILPKRPKGRPPKRKYNKTITKKEVKVTDVEKKPQKRQRKISDVRKGERSSNRTIKKPIKEDIITNEQWTKAEKKKLLAALKKHDPTDYTSLSKHVTTKSALQIDLFLQRMKRYAEVEEKEDASYTSVPVDNWISLGRDIINKELKDYTECFSTILSVISHFEEFTPPTRSIPDYRAIYRYLSCIFMEKEAPNLGPLESAVVLDLLHSLVEVLRTHSTSTQRKVMKWKYELLKTNTDTPNSTILQARKAFTNDFSDFMVNDASNANKSSTKQKDNSQSQESVNSANQSERTTQNDNCQSQASVNSANQSQQTTQNDNSQSQNSAPNANQSDPSVKNEPGRRGRKRKIKCEEDEDVKLPRKPALFTLNPFCIPVNLLNLRQRKMVYHPSIEKPLQVNAIVPTKRGHGNFQHPVTRARPIMALEAYRRLQNQNH